MAFSYYLWAAAFTKWRSTNLKQITIAFNPGTNIGTSAETVDISTYLR